MNMEARREFKRIVWKHYRQAGRHALPWRKTRDPYRILVSEVMLQQTQVERVIPYFSSWLTLFPDVHALAKARLGNVLRAWQGLGYNRRAKMLHETAKRLVKEHDGVFPKSLSALEQLPGIGQYTARAVCAFAYNQDVVFVETNIRTAVLYHFFLTANPSIYGRVSDGEIVKILEEALPKKKSREWNWALMDYGAHLKKSGVRLNAQAKGYTKQKKFAGSAREARGAILRALTKGSKDPNALSLVLGKERRAQIKKQITALRKEGLIELSKGVFRLPR